MIDLWVALGLVLVLEGAMYALFPHQMIEMLKKLPDVPPAILRAIGLSCIAIGWLIVWLVRS
ncbi:MAG: DUF2065 domain-containing protein [Mariprofundaceae bacterium]